jgi:uncharacterized membrane protein
VVFVGFVCAPVALATAKGGKVHRRFGKIYFWAMAGVAVTALILSVALPVYFLTMVAVFSFYSAFAAYRVLYLKGMYKGARPKAVDWMAAVVTVLSSLLLFLMGFLRPELMHVGVVLVQRAPGPGKLPRIPFFQEVLFRACCNHACGPRTEAKTYNRTASNATTSLLEGAAEYQGIVSFACTERILI